MATDAQATFSIHLESNASELADDPAESNEAMRDRISAGDQAGREMGGALRRLRGSSDEVKGAKAELVAKINAERDAISAASLKMVKAGTPYDQVAAKTKKLAKEHDELKKKAEADTLAKQKSRAEARAFTIAHGEGLEAFAALETAALVGDADASDVLRCLQLAQRLYALLTGMLLCGRR